MKTKKVFVYCSFDDDGNDDKTVTIFMKIIKMMVLKNDKRMISFMAIIIITFTFMLIIILILIILIIIIVIIIVNILLLSLSSLLPLLLS